MIEAICGAQSALYPGEIEAMLRLRHRVFVDRLNWVAGRGDGLERDDYDALNPIYLLARADDGQLLGTWRLLPTTGPYMLRDTFPELLAGTVAPSHTGIWETSRFAVDGGLNGEAGLDAVSKATRELFCGLVELCLDLGIAEILTMYDIHIQRLLRRVGCTPKWQSERRRIGNTIAVAGRFDINETVLATFRERAEISGSVLHSHLLEVDRRAA
ncbi:MAG: acyl-homoserine-lactone synthase [Alphaproteobacteria bacterium]|jgi:acyl homoserine lactone synthase|nr:acyl-homoserine-lactone synthase [Alphaproteobacteria bacterium]